MLKRSGGVAILLILGVLAVGPAFAALSSDSRVYLPMVAQGEVSAFAPFGPLPEVELDLTTVKGEGTPLAVTLKESLTADQQQALSKVLDKYSAQMAMLARQAPSAPGSSKQGTGRMSSAELNARIETAKSDLQAAQALGAQLAAIQTEIDGQFASILNAEQLAMHKAITASAVKPNALADAQVAASSARVVADNAELAADAGGCYYSAQLASLARYWAHYANNNAYYNYLYYDQDSYAYYAQYYLYYAQYYGYGAKTNLGSAYFDLNQIGGDFDGNGAAGSAQEYNTQYYAYYGYANAFNNYNYSGGSGYAYYAYQYAWNAYYYSYYGYAYSGYCY